MVDNEQFEAFVNKYRKDLYRYCYSRSGNDEILADEALSDTIKVLYEKWDTLDKGRGLRVYVFRIAEFCVKSRRTRKDAYYSRNQSLEAALAEGAFDNETYCDRYFNDETPIEIYIEKIMNKLTKEERELFELRFIEKKTLQQIAKIKDVPYSTLRYRIFKLEERVREEVKIIFK